MSDRPNFSDILGDMGLPGGMPRTPARPAREEKGVPWRARIIEGAYYVPLEQVADLLEANDTLPKVREGIRRRVASTPKGEDRE